MSQIILSHVSKYYDAVQALAEVSLEVAAGEFAVFVGPSGCGKSTLLRSIAGLEGISQGSIVIGDRDVTHVAPSERDVAMVFQSYALYPHMSVRQNIEFGLKVNGVAPDERQRRVGEAARILQLEELLDRRPSQISGGQRQRVAIGRAIVKQPKVFLFDEPLSNLDANLRVQMRVELKALHAQLGATIVYVTHDQVEAMTMADKIVVLNEGRVEQIDHPLELYNRPSTQFVAGFIGAPSMNFLALESGDGVATYNNVPIARDLPLSTSPAGANGRPARVGIRPEHIIITENEAAGLTAMVAAKESLGGESYLYLDTALGDRVVVKTSGGDNTKPGDTVGLILPPERLHFFDADGKATAS